MPSATGYDVAVPAVQPPIAPSFGPQVIAPQVHAQLTALPSTSFVHNLVCSFSKFLFFREGLFISGNSDQTTATPLGMMS